LPLITLEEHFVSQLFVNAPELNKFPPTVKSKLLSFGEERIKDMQNGNISIQVISHNSVAGPAPSPDVCRKANDELYHGVVENKSTNRFMGFAMLPMQEPSAAVEELTRCVNELHFVGALISNHTNGKYYDDESYWPIFERAQELDVPIYLHPTFPTIDMMTPYQGNYPKDVSLFLAAYGWGWHSDTGLHFLRLFSSGLFDRYPRLKMVIGHMGEMLPYMLDRVELFTNRLVPRERSLKKVWEENLWITTSGMFTLGPFSCLLRTVKMDRILYSVDYPFNSNGEGSKFIEEISKSGLITEDELAMFAYRNAEKLLKIKV